MPTARLPMRKVRDVLRLKADGLSKRQIAASLGLSPTAAGECLRRAREAGLGWPLPDGLTDTGLEARLYPSQGPSIALRPLPDWAAIHRELKRKGVTLLLLWEEHRGQHPDGHAYSRFCELYRAWARKLSPTMRQTHVAGERLFVDYAGTTIDIFDALTGEVQACQLFVATLGASSLTYAEATWTQGLPDWIGAHVRVLAFLGGVPAMVVSDNLKSGITSCRRRALRCEGLLLRACRQSQLRRDGEALQHGDRAGAALQAARQGQGRGWRSSCDALDHRQAQEPPLLLAGRVERGHS